MRATGIDHVVLVCADVERSLRWWQDGFGLEPVRVDEWRRGEAPFPSLRLNAGTILDFVPGTRSGENVAHVAVVVELDGDDLDAAAAARGFDVVEPARRLYGARGVGQGVYVRDPDGNVVELRHYPAG